MPTTVVRRLISALSNSSELVLWIYCQCAREFHEGQQGHLALGHTAHPGRQLCRLERGLARELWFGTFASLPRLRGRRCPMSLGGQAAIRALDRTRVILTADRVLIDGGRSVDKIKVTAHLSAPIVTGGGCMTLDGLLAAILFDELQDVATAHAAIPVKSTAGLFHASAAVMEPIERGRIAFIASLRPGHSMDPDHIKKNKHGQLHRKFDTSLTNVMNGYRLLTVPTVTWYAEGAADQIRRLLAPVEFIGKRRASGFGRVTQWTFEQDELDGIEGPFGEPLRPVPIDMFKGDKSLPVVDAAWRPAYWRVEHRAACYVPD